MAGKTNDHLRFRHLAAQAFLAAANDPTVPVAQLKGSTPKLYSEFKSRGLRVGELKKMAHLASQKYGPTPRITLTDLHWEFTASGAADWLDDFRTVRSG